MAAGRAEEQNIKHRLSMEDRIVIDNTCNGCGDGYFFAGVYDGHNGEAVVEYVASKLHAAFAGLFFSTPTTLPKRSQHCGQASCCAAARWRVRCIERLLVWMPPLLPRR